MASQHNLTQRDRTDEDSDRREDDDDDETSEDGAGCDWGFSRQDAHKASDGVNVGLDSDSSKFIPIYESYLADKQSVLGGQQTKNSSTYSNNPQKSLREWFENEGHEFEVKVDQPREGQYICSLDLPIDDHDFSLTSEVHGKKQDAIDEICLVACRMLDQCELLYSWQFGANKESQSDRKRRIDEANKEDDIEFDSTKRQCHHSSPTSDRKTTSVPMVNTYESLMAKWNQLNMSILQLKAKLVKLDLSVTKAAARVVHKPKQNTSSSINEHPQGTTSASEPNDINDDENDSKDDNDDDEIDPLDEYMSTLETKTKLSMDEKIEKSRIKSQIQAYEREQSSLTRMIELAKPKFSLNKACPPTKGNARQVHE